MYDAEEWKAIGCDVKEAKKWMKYGYDIEEAKEWIKISKKDKNKKLNFLYNDDSE